MTDIFERRLEPTAAREPASFSILQWNTLADRLAHGSFTHSPQESLAWAARRDRILAALIDISGLAAGPDVICLQEIDHYEDFFVPRLEAHGYAGVFAPKSEAREGCCLFVRSDRFELREPRTLRFRDSDTGAPQTQVALIARLRPLDDEPEIYVATTHLKAKSGHEQVRHEQAKQLLAALPAEAPLLVAGDFNDVPGSPAHAEFQNSSLQLGSAYADLAGGVEPPWTTWKVRADGEVRRTIDYIWYSREYLRPRARLTLPDDSQIGAQRLPSWQYPSDHLSLVVTFDVTRS